MASKTSETNSMFAFWAWEAAPLMSGGSRGEQRERDGQEGAGRGGGVRPSSMSNGARQTQRAGRRKRRATCRAASGQHAGSHARTGRQRCRAAPSLVKKMVATSQAIRGCSCRRASEPTAGRRSIRPRVSRVETAPFPVPLQARREARSNSMSAAAAWADARADRPEPPGESEP